MTNTPEQISEQLGTMLYMPEDANQNVDLNQAYYRRLIADRVKEQIDVHTLENARGDGFRDHLGWSVIGHECSRYLYYHWHWFKQDKANSARKQRIFDKGDGIEIKIRKALKERGAKFLDEADETGKQLKVTDCGEHFGGSVDGIFIWPEIGITEPIGLECKSSKTGATFNNYFKDTVMVANPRYYRQISGYGYKLGIKYWCFVVENKNDSEFYIEIVDLDWSLGQKMTEKAVYIMTTTELPVKISNKKSFWVCNMCVYQEICHGSEKPEPNCRNCVSCTPVDKGQFNCSNWNSIIPAEAIKKGCDSHRMLPY